MSVDLGSVFRGADAFEQTLCSSTWLLAKGLFSASQSLNSRVLCCNAGSYLLDSNTNDMLVPGASQSAQTQWKHIPPIWAVADNDACDACPTGNYTNELNLQTSCTTCPRDEIAPTAGLTGCAPCTAPTFSNDGIKCKICGAGKFTSIGISETHCEPCEAGLYQELSGNSTCLHCPAGWNQDKKGKPFCFPCTPGMSNVRALFYFVATCSIFEK